MLNERPKYLRISVHNLRKRTNAVDEVKVDVVNCNCNTGNCDNKRYLLRRSDKEPIAELILNVMDTKFILMNTGLIENPLVVKTIDEAVDMIEKLLQFAMYGLELIAEAVAEELNPKKFNPGSLN